MRFRSITTLALVTLGVMTVSAAVAGVVWDRTFGGAGGDRCDTVIRTDDGGFVLGGYVQLPDGDQNIRVVKVDGAGNTLWSTDVGGAALDVCTDIIETVGGDLIIVGHTGIPPTNFNGLLVRLDGAGNELWQRSYGGIGEDILRAVYETGSGDLVAAGDTYGGDSRVYLLRTDPDGNLRWQTSLGQADDHAYGVAKSNDGGILIAGWRGDGNTFPEFDALLVKTNVAGTPISTWTYDNGIDDRAYDMIATPDGNIALAGVSAGKLSLWKVDHSGGLFWQQTYGQGDVCTSVAATPAGFLLTGYYYNHDPGTQFQMVVVEAAAGGAFSKSDEVGGDLWDIPWGVTACTDGDYIVAGQTTSFGAGGYDWYVVRGEFDTQTSTGVGDAPAVPLALSAAPNPFNPQTRISFTVPSAGHARLGIYDVTGRRVATLVDGPVGAGTTAVTWRGEADGGRGVASGVYFARLEANGFERVYKLVVTK